MKVICKRTGVYGVKSGKTFELKVGENDLDKEQAEKLIARKIVSLPGDEKQSKSKEDEDPEGNGKKSSKSDA